MASFKYTDSVERTYVFESGNVHAKPGEVYELDADPGDGRWEAVNGSVKAPEASVSVHESDPETTTTKGA